MTRIYTDGKKRDFGFWIFDVELGWRLRLIFKLTSEEILSVIIRVIGGQEDLKPQKKI
jgi:hypothetical protein